MKKHKVTIRDRNFVIKPLSEYIALTRDIIVKDIDIKFNDIN